MTAKCYSSSILTRTSTMKIRILIVQNESLVRKVLARILANYSDVEVVGEAATGEEAIRSVGTVDPHVVLMDISMPRMDGITATQEIKRLYPHVKVIGLTEHAEGYELFAMTTAGADSVHMKSMATEHLYAAIKRATADLDLPGHE